MNMRFTFALVFLLLLDLPVSAESTCMECFKAAQEERSFVLGAKGLCQTSFRRQRRSRGFARTNQGSSGVSLPRPRCTDVPFFC